MENLFDLNKEQQRAFNRLKKAYKDCEKLKVFFVNQYGTLNAYNGYLIDSFGDDEINPSGHNVKLTDAYEKFIGNTNTIETCSGMADDEGIHVLGLTNKGLKVYKSDY